jgi:hypothetical protein
MILKTLLNKINLQLNQKTILIPIYFKMEEIPILNFYHLFKIHFYNNKMDYKKIIINHTGMYLNGLTFKKVQFLHHLILQFLIIILKSSKNEITLLFNLNIK